MCFKKSSSNIQVNSCWARGAGRQGGKKGSRSQGERMGRRKLKGQSSLPEEVTSIPELSLLSSLY